MKIVLFCHNSIHIWFIWEFMYYNPSCSHFWLSWCVAPRLSFIFLLLLLFLFFLGLHCKWRPPPPDKTFHLRAAQSSALTNLHRVNLSSANPASSQLQVRFCFNPSLTLFAIMRYDHSKFSNLSTSFYWELHPLLYNIENLPLLFPVPL